MSARWFPILGRNGARAGAVPWGAVAKHAPQAFANHGQTLERLAERGGLCWAELLAVMEGRSWGSIKESEAEAHVRVIALLAAGEAR